jgi:hypothetical protein
MSLFGSKETSRKANNGNPVEKAAMDAETAKYRMKKQEYQAKQGDYAIKVQAQQQAAQQPVHQPVQQPMYQQASQIPQERDLGGYTQPKPVRKAKKPQTLSSFGDDFGKKHGGWNKNVLTKAEERRWKKNYG